MELSRFERTLLFNRINVTFRWRKLHKRWMMVIFQKKLEEIVGFEGRKSQQEIQQMPGAWVLSCPASCQWGWHMLAPATRWQKEESPKKVCDEKSFFLGAWWFSIMTHRGIKMMKPSSTFFLLPPNCCLGVFCFHFRNPPPKLSHFFLKQDPTSCTFLKGWEMGFERWKKPNGKVNYTAYCKPTWPFSKSPSSQMQWLSFTRLRLVQQKNHSVFLFFSPPVN